MRALNRLTAKGASAAPPGKYADGGGLWLFKRQDGGAQWFLRITVAGRRREMGLGPYPACSIAEARRLAEAARAEARAGLDPIRERQRRSREAVRNLHLLKDVVMEAFESRKAELKGDGVAGRWLSPLELHVLPKLGGRPIAEIDQIDIKECLAPIWHVKAETARKAMNRLSICMKYAAAMNLPVDLQATEKARALLGKQRHQTKSIPSMPWAEVPEFYASLNDGTATHLALRLLILTGLRSSPIRNLHLDEIEDDIWMIPGEKMKGGRDKTPDFRLTLSSQAIATINRAKPLARGGYLFPSARKGVISDATMSRLMERRGLTYRPHGFRTSLRVWLDETTDARFEVAETMINHEVGGAVERAYRRTDYLEQRRPLYERWSKYVAGD